MKNSIILLLLLLSFGNFKANCQDTIFYKKGKEVGSLELAEKYSVVTYGNDKKDEATERIFNSSGQIRSETFYSSYKKEKKEGKRTTWKENGDLHTESFYKNGKLHGTFVSYWPDGKMKRKDNYKRGKFRNGKVWNADGTEGDFYPMEQRPEFPGGMEALSQYLKLNIQHQPGKSGRVIINFMVDRNGDIQNVELAKGSVYELNQEAYRVVKAMPKWKPGKQDGEPVNVFYSLPINFQGGN